MKNFISILVNFEKINILYLLKLILIVILDFIIQNYLPNNLYKMMKLK